MFPPNGTIPSYDAIPNSIPRSSVLFKGFCSSQLKFLSNHLYRQKNGLHKKRAKSIFNPVLGKTVKKLLETAKLSHYPGILERERTTKYQNKKKEKSSGMTIDIHFYTNAGRRLVFFFSLQSFKKYGGLPFKWLIEDHRDVLGLEPMSHTQSDQRL